MAGPASQDDLEELAYELRRRLDRLEAEIERLHRTVIVHVREHGA